MAAPAPASNRAGPGHGVRLLAVSCATLFSCDVLVNLRFAERVVTGASLFARPRDFLGLALAIAPLALACAAGTGLAAIPALARLLKLDRASASVALLAGALGAWAFLGVVVPLNDLPFTRPQFALLGALVGGMLVAALAAPLRLRGPPQGWTTGAIAAWSLLPAFGVAALSSAVARGCIAGPFVVLRVLSGSGTLLVAVALCAGFVRGDRRARGTIARACGLAIPIAAIAAAIATCLASDAYGRWRGARPARVASPARPNIVLVVLDTVRADHLRRYGYARDTMPGLERLADHALVAARAVSPAGWTTPAHASIFSGLTPSQHGIDYASDPAEGLRTRALPGIRWLPDVLVEHGYTTIAVAANELAIPPEVTGFTRAFAPNREEWNDAGLGKMVETLLPRMRWVGEAFAWRLPYVDAEGIVDVALRALPDGGPIFLFVNFMDAHSPYAPPPSAQRALGVHPGHAIDRTISHRELTQLWPTLPAGAADELRDLYDAELRFTDEQLTRLLAQVDARLGPDTVVVVTADHGEELGEDGRVGHEFGLSQALIHVPLVVRAPELEPGTLQAPVTLRNLFGFLSAVGEGHGADRDELTRQDEFGILSERARSGYNLARLGSAYDRAWVAGFAGGLKAVGPSESGSALFDVDSSGFDRELPITDAPAAAALRERIDRYWDSFRERRKRGGHPGLPAVDDGHLRSTGYAK